MKKNLLLLLLCFFSFSAIHADDNGSCGANLTWEFTSSDGTLTISGTGDMTDYNLSSKRPDWFSRRSEIKKVVIKDGVTSIGNATLFDLKNLTSVVIPNSVKSIGEYAFYQSEGFTSIEIPNSVKSIGLGAFSGCNTLTSIEIPNSVTSIGEHAFYNCNYLESITIGKSVTSIGQHGFSSCDALKSITFKGSSAPDFGANVFKDINENVSVYVPANSIEQYKTNLGGLSSKVKALNLIALADNAPYTMDSQSDGIDVSYTRNFTNACWQALYLPFSLKYDDWKDDFEMAYINGAIQRDNDDDGVIDETELEIIKMKKGSTKPNAPYLIRAKTTGGKTFYVKNTTVYAAEKNSVDCSTTTAKFTFTGTYNTIPYETLIANHYFAMGGGELVISNGSDLRPFRWYMNVESRDYSKYSVDNGAKVITLKVLDDEETTGVSELRMTNDELPVYDLNGRKVSENNLKPGIYVKNGKKFIVK